MSGAKPLFPFDRTASSTLYDAMTTVYGSVSVRGMNYFYRLQGKCSVNPSKQVTTFGWTVTSSFSGQTVAECDNNQLEQNLSFIGPCFVILFLW